ncbi:MAG TPA: hypothetical protein VKV23_00030 [Acidimicrobiales bacterium]|nr:hypothetical protein [Acidimicrobiales bacterium]
MPEPVADPIALLRAADPVPAEAVRGARRSASAVALCDAILATKRRRLAWHWQLTPVLAARRAAATRHAPARAPELDLLRRHNPAPTVAPAGLSMRAEALRESILAGARDDGRASQLATPAGERPDLLDVLRGANPRRAQPAPSRLSARAEALLASIVAERAAAAVPWWRRRRVLAPLAGVLALGATAAGYTLANAPPSQSFAVVCYASDSLQAARFAPGAGSDPVAACELAAPSASPSSGSAPRFVGCILPSGTEGLFPGTSSDVCTRLGLPAALPPTPEDVRLASFVSYLSSRLTAAACVGEQAAVQVAEAAIARFAMSGWRVVPGASAGGTGASCATARVDGAHDEVVIIAVARPPAP